MDKKVAQKLVDKTRKDYNRIYRKFSSTRSYLWPDIGKAIEGLKLKKGEEVLDVGCGNGRFVPLIEGSGAVYTGLDISDKLLEVAKETYPKTKFVLGDAIKLPFKDGEFDIVISIATIHHIPSRELREEAIAEMARVLKPGGKLLISSWYFWNQGKYLKLIIPELMKGIVGRSKLDFGDFFKPWNKSGDISTNRYFHAYTQRELLSILEKNHFKNIKKQPSDRNLIFTAKK